MYAYDNYHQTMNIYDIMFTDKCINMTYNNDNVNNIICNPDAFHFMNGFITIFSSIGFGFYLSFILVTYFMDTFGYPNRDNIEQDSGTDEVKNYSELKDDYTKMYNELFDTLPKDGYKISSYPFTYKLEDKTPFGDIIMFLNVYKDDYLENNDSIEYTYYTQSNSWMFSQLSIIAKKIGIELNTKQFYKDKTIRYGITRDEIIAEKNKTNKNIETIDITDTNNDITGLGKNYENGEQSDERNGDLKINEEKSVFAKFKTYNKGSKSGGIVKSNTSTNVNEINNDNLIEPSRILRLGTIEEYKIELLRNEVKKRMKNISFGEFKTKSNGDLK